MAFLVAIAAEMLIDLLMVGGTGAVCAVAVGGAGLVLSRKFWRHPEVVHQSGAGTRVRKNVHCCSTNVNGRFGPPL